jgi:hypothetical protein
MARVCWLIGVFFILLASFTLAQPISAASNPQLINQGQALGISETEIAALFDKLAKDLMSYNDENFRAFDSILKAYISDVERNVQTKAIVGILGVNALVAGFFFYFLNKKNKDLSYESVSLRRRKDDEDRKYLVENINYIRERLDYLEEDAKRRIDTYVLPTNQLDRQIGAERRKQYNDYSVEDGGSQYGGDGREYWAPEEAGYAVEGGYEQSAYPEGGSEVYGRPAPQGRTPEERYV